MFFLRVLCSFHERKIFGVVLWFIPNKTESRLLLTESVYVGATDQTNHKG
jgi:hypothetical protein